MIKLTSGRTNGRNFLLICISLLFLLQKTSLSILTQTSGQFEETTKQFIEQQQLQREEAQKTVRGFFWKSSSQNSWNSQKSSRKNSKNLFTSIK